VEKTVQPKLVRADGPLEGLSQKEIPPARGYVLTHPKPLAEVLMKVEDNPLLVTWRYGLGRVVAFTSDLSGRWGRDWLRWERFPQWSSQLARSVMRRVSEDRVRTELRQDGEEMEAQVDFISTGGTLYQSSQSERDSDGARSDCPGEGISSGCPWEV